MSTLIQLKDFYKNHLAKDKPAEHSIGHFHIFKLEELIISNGKALKYNRRDFFKVSLIEGHSQIDYADQSVEVQGHALVFTNPAIPYKWQPISEQQNGYVCIFTEDFAGYGSKIKEYPVFSSAKYGVARLGSKDAKLFGALFNRMYAELQGGYTYKYDLLRTLLMEVVHLAQKKIPAEISSTDVSNGYDRIATLFAELLERQFPIDEHNSLLKLNSPSDFAVHLNVHVNYLNKVLKKTTGQTTSQLINHRLMQEAKILLKDSENSIKAIAYSLGFSEPNHFSRLFTRKAGISPSQFRKALED